MRAKFKLGDTVRTRSNQLTDIEIIAITKTKAGIYYTGQQKGTCICYYFREHEIQKKEESDE